MPSSLSTSAPCLSSTNSWNGSLPGQQPASPQAANSGTGGSRPSAVRVAVRLRPPVTAEERAEANAAFVVDPKEGTITSADQQHRFGFERGFDQDATQEEVYREIGSPVVDLVMEGNRGAILAYGQTGSGKTFSMFGPSGPSASPDLQGLVPRAVRQVFDAIHGHIAVHCTFLEIYCGQVFDLLSPNRSQSLQVKEIPKCGFYVDGLVRRTARTAEEALQVVRAGARLRGTASTALNRCSSRSHAIFTLHIQRLSETAEGADGKLTLVDLAGSESVWKTGSTGETLQEAKSINASLSALAGVIDALADRRPHVPYRDSLLTRLLEDSLGGPCRTTLLIACSSGAAHSAETLSSLRFAARAKKVCTYMRLDTPYTMTGVNEDRRLTHRLSQIQNSISESQEDYGRRNEGRQQGGYGGRFDKEEMDPRMVILTGASREDIREAGGGLLAGSVGVEVHSESPRRLLRTERSPRKSSSAKPPPMLASLSWRPSTAASAEDDCCAFDEIRGHTPVGRRGAATEDTPNEGGSMLVAAPPRTGSTPVGGAGGGFCFGGSAAASTAAGGGGDDSADSSLGTEPGSVVGLSRGGAASSSSAAEDPTTPERGAGWLLVEATPLGGEREDPSATWFKSRLVAERQRRVALAQELEEQTKFSQDLEKQLARHRTNSGHEMSPQGSVVMQPQSLSSATSPRVAPQPTQSPPVFTAGAPQVTLSHAAIATMTTPAVANAAPPPARSRASSGAGGGGGVPQTPQPVMTVVHHGRVAAVSPRVRGGRAIAGGGDASTSWASPQRQMSPRSPNSVVAAAAAHAHAHAAAAHAAQAAAAAAAAAAGSAWPPPLSTGDVQPCVDMAGMPCCGAPAGRCSTPMRSPSRELWPSSGLNSQGAPLITSSPPVYGFASHAHAATAVTR